MTLRWERRDLSGDATFLQAYQGQEYVGYVAPAHATGEGDGYIWCMWLPRDERRGRMTRESDGRRRVNENWARWLRRAGLKPQEAP